MGSGPYNEVNSSGTIIDSYPVQNDWWGVTGLASANLSDSVHAEVGAGYKHRQTDGHDFLSSPLDADIADNWKSNGIDYNTWGILGGVYYTPVDQLTIGLEGEWYTQEASQSVKNKATTGENAGYKWSLDASTDNWTVDLVSVWRF